MLHPQWRLRPADEAVVRHLHHTLGISPTLCRLLALRGITTYDEARHFFRAGLDALHSPFQMRDMDKAVDRLDRAFRQNERILLYGDYDVDGTTSVALLFSFLSGFHQNLDYYLPDRLREGYGVSREGVAYARQTGATLVVALDCGIKAHAPIVEAAGAGIDFIVCDHHLPDESLPPAVAVLDPKRPDCPYPCKDLSGCGIAFKLAQALAIQRGLPAENACDLLDLTAVSIACDIVPITGENRILARHGLHKINREPRLGLWALLQRSGRRFPLTVSDVVFGLGPLINAAGRFGDARDAVRLLLATERHSAQEAAGALMTRNRERREADQKSTEEARQQVEGSHERTSRKSIVVFSPAWHKGIIGIVASRLVERFHKPAVVLTLSEGKLVGSARSVPDFDLHEALNRCAHLFHSFGGHAHAAGLQLPPENLETFSELFETVVRETLPPEAEAPLLHLDAEVRLADITPGFWRTLRQFAPFGPGNHTPVFLATGVADTGQSRLLTGNHARFYVQQEPGGPVFTGIGFGLGEKWQALKDRPFDLAFSLFDDHWQGESTLALRVRDLRETA